MSTLSYIALGSNLGDREHLLREAVRSLDNAGGNNVTACSPAYECEALSIDDELQPAYLNAVVEVSTRLSAISLLMLCHDIELQAGRVRDNRKWAPRTLDLDILLFGSVSVNSPALVIPHPGLHKRRFVLQPLADIAPDLQIPHPVNATVAEVLDRCNDPLSVVKYSRDIFVSGFEAAGPSDGGLLADSGLDLGDESF